MSVAITNLQRVRKINRRLLKQIVDALLTELELQKAEIGVCLVNGQEMTRLNETFLRHAGSTDVITFDYQENLAGAGVRKLLKREPTPERQSKSPHGVSCKEIHGEIFVCVDEAVLQARTFGTHWQSEIVRYVVHGVLHLTGHDDRRSTARRKMKREEDRLLAGLSRRFSLAQLSRPVRLSA
jgi:probable rRNA maturation factor